jgi:A/G-specific adenine glycosylase
VLGRLLAGDTAVAMPVIQPIADRAAAATDPGPWTHALMDLGATVCRPRHPRCADCPVLASCRYAATVQPAPPSTRAAGHGTTTPFPSTNRWLRGRILDRLRAAPDGGWVVLDEPIGVHAVDRVHQAAGRLAEDGLVELDRSVPAVLHARLATA